VRPRTSSQDDALEMSWKKCSRGTRKDKRVDGWDEASLLAHNVYGRQWSLVLTGAGAEAPLSMVKAC
jgi:hypothetical protein